MTQSVLRLASSGLDVHEQGLLAQQLRMLKGRTQAQWQYVADATGAELSIVRHPGSLPNRALAAFRAANGGKPIDKLIEWPLRLFGLAELLGEYEACYVPRTVQATPLMSERLASLTTPATFILGGQRARLLPEQGRVQCDFPAFETLLAVLADEQGVWSADTCEPVSVAADWSLKQVIWALALTETPRNLEGWLARGSTYRILAWPEFGEWRSSASLLRMAALYSRQFASVEQGAAFSLAEPADVVAFLHACEQCGLGLERKAETTAMGEPVAAAQDGGSLLQRLRQRLGLGLRKG